MSKKTLALIIGLSIVTSLLVYIAVSQKSPSNQQNLTSYVPAKPSPTPSPLTTTLSFSPNPLFLSSQSAQIVDVVVNSNGSKITGVQLELTYDPKVVTITDVSSPKTDGFIKNPMQLVKKIDPESGKITFAIVVPPNQEGSVGVGKVATINLRANLKPEEQTTLQFLPQSLVTAEGFSASVLKSTEGVVITRTATTTITPSQ